MKRQITDYLIEWKESLGRKPLLIKGARQVGKTYAVEMFGKMHFPHYIKINFEEQPEFKPFFRHNDVKDTLQQLELVLEEEIIPGKTLLFLDEIQACPEAIVSLRYFYEKIPNLHLIAAGSLIDFTLAEWPYSMPVGRIEFAYMYPLNFPEFLQALGQEKLATFIENWNFEKPINPVVHDKLLELVRYYYFIGGMPEAVKIYAETGSLLQVKKVHESILSTLSFDFAKYGTRNQQEILQYLLQHISSAIGQKFKYAKINPQATWRTENIKTALQLLEKSRLISLVYATKADGLPLEKGKNFRSFKPFFLDIGLLNHLLKLPFINISGLQLTSAHEGVLAEQFVAQQIRSTPPWFLEKKLYYWHREKRNAEAEIDLLTDFTGQILPIEIKSGKTGRLKSLHLFMAAKGLKTALRFNADFPLKGNVKATVSYRDKKETVSYMLGSLPLYLAAANCFPCMGD